MMSSEQILMAAIINSNSQTPENTRGHLTTREMFAAQPNRSEGKSLLATMKNKLTRR